MLLRDQYGLWPDWDYILNVIIELPEAIGEAFVSGEAADSFAGTLHSFAQEVVDFVGINAELKLGPIYGNTSAYNLGFEHPELGGMTIIGTGGAAAVSLTGVGNLWLGKIAYHAGHAGGPHTCAHLQIMIRVGLHLTKHIRIPFPW